MLKDIRQKQLKSMRWINDVHTVFQRHEWSIQCLIIRQNQTFFHTPNGRNKDKEEILLFLTTYLIRQITHLPFQILDFPNIFPSVHLTPFRYYGMTMYSVKSGASHGVDVTNISHAARSLFIFHAIIWRMELKVTLDKEDNLGCFDTVFRGPYLMFSLSFLPDIPQSDRCEIYTNNY